MAQTNTGIVIPLFRKITNGFQKIFISAENVMLKDNSTTIQDYVDNNSLVSYSLSDANIQTWYNTADFSMYKIGNIVFFNISLNVKSGTTFLANQSYCINAKAIPKECRPKSLVYLDCFGVSGTWGTACKVACILYSTGYIYINTPEVKSFYKIHGSWVCE